MYYRSAVILNRCCTKGPKSQLFLSKFSQSFTSFFLIFSILFSFLDSITNFLYSVGYVFFFKLLCSEGGDIIFLNKFYETL